MQTVHSIAFFSNGIFPLTYRCWCRPNLSVKSRVDFFGYEI